MGLSWGRECGVCWAQVEGFSFWCKLCSEIEAGRPCLGWGVFCPPLTNGVSGEENVDGGSGAGLRALSSDCGGKEKGVDGCKRRAQHLLKIYNMPHTALSSQQT